VLLCGLSSFAVAAHAQDATWLLNPNPAGDFNTATNWTPATVPTGTAFFGVSNVTSLSFSANNTTIGGWTFNTGASNYTFTNDQALTFNGAGITINGGSASITNNFGAFLNFNNASTAGSATITNNFDGVAPQGGLNFFDTSTAGSATITNHGTLQFFNTSTAGSASITNSAFVNLNGFGTLIFNDASTAGSASITNDSILEFFGTSTAGSATIANNGQILVFQSASGGAARFIFNGTSFLDISALSTGGTTAGSIEGAGTIFLGANNLTVGGNDLSTTFSGAIKDGGLFGGTGGSLTKTGIGTLTLTGTNAYTGATTVNAGALEVDGSIAASSLTSVNNAGALTGVGTIGAAQINSGGVFAPGNIAAPGTFMTVSGNLAFQSGAIYLVSLNPSAATFANVTGTASLAGTVKAFFALGSYAVSKTYDILHSAGLNNTKFSGLVGAPPNFQSNLTYTPTDVLLTLTATLGALNGSLNDNQQNVATAMNNFFNSGGTLPPNFAAIFGLTGPTLANALSQLDGEVSTDADKGAFDLMTQFLNLMLDPYVDGRGSVAGGMATPFAPEQDASFPPDIALAYDAVLKAPPKQSFDQRWTAWGAPFGGYNKTNGDPVVGSNNVIAHDFGFAAGMDYHFSPDTLAGFSLSGGGTSWGLAQGLGSGRSDAFAGGVYAKTRSGPAYLAGALAFADHWFTTNRTAAFSDQLTASFNGQSYGGRAEAGYRYAVQPMIGVTPYAALQAQGFHTPAYRETDLTGGGFALAYNAMNATDTRSELGTRFDDLITLGAMPLVLRGRLAWAHDWFSNPALGAVFQALPGTNFVVNGAAPAKNSALATAAAELHISRNWSATTKFDGEFAKVSQTYAGTETLRYTW
jgi:autotransporter-associated beta strand protein